MPDPCDGCSSPFSLSHALSCRKGGLVIQCHNEVHDFIGDLVLLVWNWVRREPVVREADGEAGTLHSSRAWLYMVCGYLRLRRCSA